MATGYAPKSDTEDMDLYALLNVSPTATSEEIRRAYGAKARETQHDCDLFAEVGRAWEQLKTPEKRAQYDVTRNIRSVKMAQATEQYAAQTQGTRMDATQIFGQGGQTGRTLQGTERTTQFAEAPRIGGGEMVFVGEQVQTRGGEATQAFNAESCEGCQTPLALGEEFCLECGLLPGSLLNEKVSASRLPKLVEDTGRAFTLRAGDNIVGREEGELVLPDRTVSRRHAKVRVEANGSVSVEDLGSTNGTKHNGGPTPAGRVVPLENGDKIQFGSVKLTAHLPQTASPERLALPSIGGQSTGEPAPLALAAPDGVTMNGGKITAFARLVTEGGAEHVLGGTRTTFGRRDTNDVVLTGDTTVSGAHAVLVFDSGDNGTFKLVDLGSTNGTQLNGQRVISNVALPVKDGDTITMGRTQFTFRAPKVG